MRSEHLNKHRNQLRLIFVTLVTAVTLSYALAVQGQTEYSIWNNTVVPTVESENDANAIEVGVKFQADVDGTIDGILFYKGASNTGTHNGNLWDSAGNLLATATFTGETASGWQRVDFAAPVPIHANTTYIASYHTTTGFYSLDNGYFTSTGVDNPPLRAPQDGEDGGNGVYIYSATSAFPTQSDNGANYWVDVVFTIGPDTLPPLVTNQSPAPASTTQAPGTNITAGFNEDIDPLTVTSSTFELRDQAGSLVPAAISYNASTKTAILNPTSNLTAPAVYTATLRGGADPAIKDPAGNPLAADTVWSFNTESCLTNNNSIVCENLKPGNPSSEWDITGAGDLSIQGFATEMSVDQGETVRFKIDTDATNYRLDIYRMGYYGGLGARLIDTVLPSATLPQTQPACFTDGTTGLVDCGNWAESASWAVPADATSGIYFAKVIRTDTSGASHIVFIVRDDDGGSDLLFQTADTTWQAYNSYGGNSFYVGQPAGRAYKVSYNRPFLTRDVYPEDWVFNAEYPLVRWLEENGYNVSYFSGIDTDRLGAELLEHQIYLSVGHDEYWSNDQRLNIEAARDAGVNLAFFSGNEMFWKHRWENSIDGTNTPYRTLVSYKETHDNAKTDPLPNVWTGTWRDPRFSPPADGGRPENAVTGQLFLVNVGTYAIEVPYEDGLMRFWRNTSIANLQPGQTATLSDFTLGYEWDEDADNGFRPAGIIRVSSTSVTNAEILVDYGSTYQPGSNATHNMTLYRAPSGALVFGSGTVQWSWGLDGNHDRLASTPDSRMQQATVNLFADMGVQPSTLMSGLTPATQSSDSVGPSSNILSPLDGATVEVGVPITVTGSAVDTGGGVVGGIEISVDGGSTWSRANGRGSWTYVWTPDSAGSTSLLSRAADDSANIGSSSGITVTATTAPDTINPTVDITNPTNGTIISGTVSIDANASDNYSVAGVQFQVDGSDFGAEDTVSPYSIDWNTLAVSNSFYSLTAIARDAAGNTTTSTVISVTVDNPPDTTPPTVSTVSPIIGATNVPLNSTVTATFNENIDPATVTGATFELRDGGNNLVPAVVTYDGPSRTAILTPNSDLVDGTTYQATLIGGPTDPRIKDFAGNALAADFNWTFTAGNNPYTCPCSIWSPSDTPVNISENDNSAVEVGVKFQADVDGEITGIRFYKGPSNTGTHIGNLWTSTGQLLGTATFSNETASGWQQVDFGAPVSINANVTYVASYHTDVGFYSQDENYFSGSGVNNPPLRALATNQSGESNGVYQYGPSSFPAQASNSANYWVDVIFTPASGPDTTSPVVTTNTPSNGAVSVSPNINITVGFNEPIDQTSVTTNTLELRDSANTLITATISYNSGSRIATLDPIEPLEYTTAFTATVRGGGTDPRVKDTSGNALAADYVWSFTTVDPPPIPPNDGPGGPILVISSSSNPFGRYYNEILRNEGFNLFLNTDISLVTPSNLATYEVVILGEMSLAPSEVTMLTDWVNAGGNLIAMRPDKQLATLLGLTDAAATQTEGYLLVNTATPPGLGIVNQTIQYHGTADLYTLSGATAVATLYANTTTPTAGSPPAVTMRSVGANGGQAAAFTYDLARSIVYTRQGNPAWAAVERDGLAPIRSDDKFYGNAVGDPQPDWVDLNKVEIPQADEQQRLLANIILMMNEDNKPLPRFWYFPDNHKAVVVMTGDDHGIGLTEDHFNAFIGLSPVNCSVNDWECVRGTSYIYPAHPLTDSEAAAFAAQGFEIALHVDTGCSNYTQSSIDANFSNQLAAFQNSFPSLPSPTTNRAHCIVFSDWISQPVVENSYGIRLDTNYYYFPESWRNGRDGFFTGSGMPMRFAALDGTLIDVYQATTQMTDESGQVYPGVSNVLLDRAIGPEGYYGAFTANIHTDRPIDNAVAVVQSAQARGIPVVSSRQMLTWLDGRNSSSFGSLNLAGNILSFTINAASGANNLQAMLPRSTVNGDITSINYNGSPISFSTQTVKGIEYVIFDALTGSYQASTTPLPPDTTPPTVSITTPTDGSVISGTVNINATATDNVTVAGVQFKLDGVNLGAEDTIAPYNIAWNTTTVANGGYQLTAVARDAAGNATTSSIVNVTVDNIPDSTPPTVIQAAPSAGSIDVNPNAVISVNFSEAMDPATISFNTFELRDSSNTLITATIAYNAGTLTASLTPNVPLQSTTAYTATIQGGLVDPRVKDLAGNALSNNYVWTFSTASPQPFSTIWSPSDTPTLASENDPSAIEVGVKFQSETSGYITGLRFYKGLSNTGTHTGNLWDITGTLLATAVFTDETSTGWQQVQFSTPVSITANTTYIASYHTTSGFYSLDQNYFTPNGVSNPPLLALADGVAGGNGVYGYSPTPAFPTISFSASNYWVDVVFATDISPDTEAPAVVILAPSEGASLSGTAPINASANDNFGVVGVQFKLDGVNLGAEDTAAPFALDWDTRTIANGSYQLTAVARDAAGNSTTSTAINVTVNNAPDTTPPTVTGVIPTSGAVGVAASTNVTVTFSEAMDPATINGTTLVLRDPTNNVVTATVGYFPNTQSAVLTPTTALAQTTRYTLTVRGGGADPRVKDPTGNAMATNFVSSFTTSAGPGANCPCSIWDGSTVPSIPSASDPNAIEVGVKFQTDINGYITGIRFYKGAANTGTHTGNLYDSAGNLLESAVFINETATGWQQVLFSNPVTVTANTTYVAAYHTTSGNYAADTGYFSSTGVDNPPLRALADGIEGGNGVFIYSATPTFPNQSAGGNNYWVDIVFATSIIPDTTPPTVAIIAPSEGASVNSTVGVSASANDNVGVVGVQFQLDGSDLGAEDIAAPFDLNWDTTSVANGPYQLTAIARDAAGNSTTSTAVNVTVNNPVDTTPPTVTGITPLNGATDVVVTTTATITFSENLDPGTVNTTTVELRDSANNLITATVDYAGQSATLTPTVTLNNNAQYTVTVRGGGTDPRVKDVAGNPLAADFVSTFTTETGPTCPCSIWSPATVPGTTSISDPNAIQLGVKFRSDVNGFVTGIRFYKGATNTGTHTGSLWDSAGNELASAVFTNETATGWQEVTFSNPVTVTANTTYIASYHTTSGNYAADNGYFTTGVDNPPLHALADGVDGGNGLYLYTSSPAFPNQSVGPTNYWVDVVFATVLDITPPTVTITSPTNGATVLATVPITATSGDDIGVAGVQFQLNGTDLGAENTASPYSINWDTTLVANGPYTITALARDAAGNTATSTPVTVTVNNPPDNTPPTVTGISPVDTAVNVVVTTTVTISFSENLDPGTVNTTTIDLRDSANNLITATVGYAGQTAILTPTNSLAYNTPYTVTVRGGGVDPRIKDTAGNALAADFVSTFTTADPPNLNCPCSIWSPSDAPVNPSFNDPTAIELGVKFRSEVSGYILGLRFYKGATNTGTHTGSLWDSAGNLLESAVFGNETATGWQEVTFSNPVTVTANTTYIASYHTTSGNYAADSGFFNGTGVDNVPLHALADGVDGGNGLFLYTGSPAFPTNSFGATNYWVDVIFDIVITPDTEFPVVTMTAPANGAVVTDTVPISADATDNITVSGVQFQLDGANLGAEDTAAPYALNWDTNTVANGPYTITAIARDPAGNSATSSPVTVTVSNPVDTTPPTVTGITPAAAAADVAITTTVIISFSENLDPGTVNTTTVDLRDSANNLITATVGYAGQTAILTPTASLDYSTLYTVTVRGGGTDPRLKDTAGNPLAADFVSTFTTADPPSLNCPCSIWGPSDAPVTPSFNDPNAIELGVKFRSEVSGYILGLRFYKGATNTGTHTGSLWDSAGNLLESAVFVNETATGWQQIYFANPVTVTANTTYVASYHTTSGNYAADGNYFASSGVDNPPLRALANGVDGPNGLYFYSATPAFPTNSNNATNYWVDVIFDNVITPDTENPVVTMTAPANGAVVTDTVPISADATDNITVSGVQFQLDGANLGAEDTAAPYSINWDTTLVANGPYTITAIARDPAGNSATSSPVTVTVSNPVDTTPPTVTGITPAAAAADVAITTTVTISFSENLDPGTVNTTTVYLRDSANNLITATVGYAGQTAILTPTNSLDFSTPYTVTVRGGGTDPRVKDVAGNPLAADFVSTFTTVPSPGADCPCTIWSDTDVPGTPSVTDPLAIEVGVKFRSEIDGYITGLRFYKGATNTGTHTGSLWDSAGNLLESAVFVNETATGWQQVLFANPVTVTGNTTYVASYHTTSGNYAADGNYFASSGVDNPPLRALANGVDGPNGLYLYSATPSFPTNSNNATNYWVDAIFSIDVTPPAVTSIDPITGSVNVNPGTAITVTFSEELDSSTVNTTTIQLRDAVNAVIPGTVTYSAVSQTAILTPSQALPFDTTFTVTIRGGAADPRVKDNADNALPADVISTFTTPSSGFSCPCTIWNAPDAPTNVTTNDPNAIELGVKFSSSITGYVTGIRFYKGPSNTGTHTGNLWDSAGNRLATAVFLNETATGWQQVNFTNPVLITANTTYIASYHTTSGFFPSDGTYFSPNGVLNPPLAALEDGIDGPNGVFLYSASSAFPTNSFNATNYWVDVVFNTTVAPDTTPPTVTVTAPTQGAVISGTVPITATATDDVGVLGVQFKLNGANLQAEDAAAPYAINWNTTAETNGSYQITAVGRDGAGNTTTSSIVTVTVDNPLDTTPPTVLGVLPADGAVDVAINASIVVTFSEAMDPATVNGTTFGLRDPGNFLIPAAVSYDTGSQTAILTPTASLANSTRYTLTVSGGVTDPRTKDLAGNALALDFLSTYTTTAPLGSNCPCTIWSDTDVPVIPSENDPLAIEVGVKFQADMDGYILGLRFYKGATNTGTHTGSLWDSAGTLLASAVFTNETATGWQEVTFSNPVTVTANTTYVASYHTTSGNYAKDEGYFTPNGVNNPPLRALADGMDGGNGVFLYTGAPAFPTQSFNATNYWVDPVFVVDITPPAVTAVNPADSSLDVDIETTVVMTVSEALDPSTVTTDTVELRDPGNGLIPAVITYSPTNQTITLTPNQSLSNGTQYTVTVRGGAVDPRLKDAAGNALAADFVSTFTTEEAIGANCPCSIWGPSDAPANPSSNDPNAIELGVKFRADVSGYIMGLRFYKGATNTGTHTGSLWDSAGNELASAVFINETATGWQQVYFANPVTVTANTTYVASYHTTSGNYAADAQDFNGAGVYNVPLRALADGVDGGNGLFLYTGSPAFPTNSFNATNYWVDVIFDIVITPDTEFPVVTMTAPANGAVVTDTVPITADATDNITVSGVQFQLNGANLGAENPAVPYALNWDTNTVANGTYTITAIARDPAGNATTSSPVTVTVSNPVDTTPPTVTGITPAAAAADVAITTTVIISFSENLDPGTVNTTTVDLRDSANNLITATVGYAGQTAILTPTNSLAYNTPYTVTVRGGGTDPRVKDVAGNPLAADFVSTFTTAIELGSNCPCTIWADTAVPDTPSVNDPDQIELGVKFRSEIDGYITGIRFYKGPSNTGTHTGSLWDSAGNLLESAVFVNETATGWQQVIFANPVTVTANTTYVASYHTTSGNYAANGSYFASSGVNNPPLRGLADGIDGPNGLYLYSATPAFPTNSNNATNYWVDVVFTIDVTPPVVTRVSPQSGSSYNGTIPLEFTASDSSGIASVQFQLNGVNLGPEFTAPPYAMNWDPSTVAGGFYQITAVVVDNAANQVVSDPISLMVFEMEPGTP